MITLAGIFRQNGSQYLSLYAENMLPSHKKAIRDIIVCRTEELGGHTWYCENCDEYHYSFHSCKNRNCPQCQNEKATEWLEKQIKMLLPVEYFMATFTLPEQLRRITRSYQKQIYNIFFQTSAETLKKLAKDPRFIGGNISMIGFLHTWTRNLEYHPHIHFIIPGIAISDNKNKIIFSKKNFLIHAKPLSIIFKAKFIDALKESGLLNRIPREAWKKDWMIDIEAVGSGETTLKYLSAYLYRIAISNKNIISYKNSKVTFRYKDSNTKTYKIKTLYALEFMRRYLQHVLPKGFQKIRYYGFLHPKCKNLLKSIQLVLKNNIATKINQKNMEFVFKCPNCGKNMILIKSENRKRASPLVKFFPELSFLLKLIIVG